MLAFDSDLAPIVGQQVTHPGSGSFAPAGGGASVSDGALRALAAMPGQEVTFTCAPPGSGARIAAAL